MTFDTLAANAMNAITSAVPVLFFCLVLGLCTYLLIRGVTHTFVCLFAVGALIETLRAMAFLFMSVAPGGFSAHQGYLPALAAVGFIGMLAFSAGFIFLTIYFVRPQIPPA